ncbi:MAG TPA: sigma-70 family RNA polymerase sigma factor [Gemmatimonadales bacterium]|nr:sigma-70 family RNA polymerase sigma factor [Gemmatimonadales bacterium]
MSLPADLVSPALESVLARFAGMVRAVGRRHGLGDPDLDEVVQDVRIRLWRARESGERIEGAPSSYVYQAARSASLDLVRRRRGRGRTAPVPAEKAAEPAAPRTSGPDRRVEDSELSEIVFGAVDGLLASRRRVVRLHLLGYESAEIAGLLGWSGGKTRNLLSRGLADLRGRLRDLGVGPEGLQ